MDKRRFSIASTSSRCRCPGIDLHFIHEPGKGPNPHAAAAFARLARFGVRITKLIPLLTDPANAGGDASDAFTVIAPSLPGYTLSFKPGQPRFGIEEDR